MSDESSPGIDVEVPVSGPEPEIRLRRPWIRRWFRRALAFVVAVVAAVLVSVFSIDLGRFPQLKPWAETRGSAFLEQPLHIGRISFYPAAGRIALYDVVIEGLAPGDRPFMKIARVDIHVPWWTLFRRQLHVTFTMDDWAMVVETWPDGVDNFPRFTSRNPSTTKNPWFDTTTVDFAYARRGHFTYEDHATPWSLVAPNLDFSMVRATSLDQYVGLFGFSGGAVQIQHYRPMATDMTTRFVMEGGKVFLRHIDLVTEGSRSHVNGEVDFSKWPNQTYNLNSEVDFSRMKDIFFAKETWRLAGSGRLTGIFKIFQGGRDLSGEFSSDDARVNDLEFHNLHGALNWTQTRLAVLHAEAELLGGHSRFDYSLAPLGSPTGSMASFSADYTDIDLFDLDRLMSLRGLRLAGLASGNIALQWPNGKFATGRHGDGPHIHHGAARSRAGHGRTPARAPSADRRGPAVRQQPADRALDGRWRHPLSPRSRRG